MSKSDEKGPSGMDISFIGKPHEWDPRRLYSQTGADWQYRVDFDRLRKDRLARLREQAFKEGMKALRVSGALKVASGITTVEEVLKTAPPARDGL